MKENYYALIISILLNEPPEASFQILERGKRDKYVLSDSDTQDMIVFRKQGLKYREIGEMYGLTECAAYKRIKYFNNYKKCRSAGTVAASR